MEELVRNDSRFEVVGKVMMGLVCFRLRVSYILCEMFDVIGDKQISKVVPFFLLGLKLQDSDFAKSS